MVHFTTREMGRDNSGDAPGQHRGWLKGEQPPTVFLRERERVHVELSTQQGAYGSVGYGTIQYALGDMRSVGKNISRAASIAQIVRDGMETTYPLASRPIPHARFERFLESSGLDANYSLIVTGVSEHLPPGGLAAVLKREGDAGYFHAPDISQKVEAIMRSTGRSQAAIMEYLHMHETVHLKQKEGRYTQDTERQAEAAVVAYCSRLLEQLRSASGMSDAQRMRLIRHYREIKAMGEERLRNVERNYRHLKGGKYQPAESASYASQDGEKKEKKDAGKDGKKAGKDRKSKKDAGKPTASPRKKAA